MQVLSLPGKYQIESWTGFDGVSSLAPRLPRRRPASIMPLHTPVHSTVPQCGTYTSSYYVDSGTAADARTSFLVSCVQVRDATPRSSEEEKSNVTLARNLILWRCHDQTNAKRATPYTHGVGWPRKPCVPTFFECQVELLDFHAKT